MQLKISVPLAAVASAALAASAAGIGLTGTTASAAAPTRTTTTIAASDDTMVAKEAPTWATGSLNRLVAQNSATLHKQAYLKFVVPASVLGVDGKIESAVLSLTAYDTSRSVVSVKATTTAWTEATTNYTNAPVGGAAVATMAQLAGRVSSANVTTAVSTPGTYAFQLTTAADVSRFFSSESTVTPPTLTVTVVTQPTTPPPPPPPPSGSKALLGMSAPNNLWAQRVSEVGAGLQARRIFLSGFTASLSLATTACNAGMSPILSFKTSGYTWAQVAAGSADASLNALATKLNALPCNVFVAIHHEPASGAGSPLVGEGGSAADYANMQAHALPLLGGAVGGKVKVGPIGNGWWFNTSGGLTDAELKTWVSPAVLAASDFVAADTYQGSATNETVSSKIVRMGAWARRTPGVRALGLGEFNMQTAQGMTDATAALASDPLFAFGCVWNMDGTGAANAHVLTGDMLKNFKTALANW